MLANFCMRILTSIIQGRGNPFAVTKLLAVNCVTDSSRHTLMLARYIANWLRQVYILHRRITSFHVVQEPTCTHAHENRLLGASCSK